MPMFRSIFLVASIALSICAISIASTPDAQAGGLCCGVCCFACPDCRCKLDAEEVEVEKSCFEVECETICVPKVVFPWQTGKGFCFGLFAGKKGACDSCDACDGHGCSDCTACVNNGAVLRKVKVLKTKKYKCPACEYTWSAEESVMGCCDDGCCDGCVTPGCDGCCASNEAVKLPPAWTESAEFESDQSASFGVVPVHAVETHSSMPAGE